MSLIKSLQITWLSPQRIKQLSFGNITSHKVVNTRTFKPELGGLFDPKIFGPFLNYECYCGKYKGRQNKGQKCERCEVLITEKNVQRWRMGHISLISPVTNIVIFKALATNLSKILGISAKHLEEIIYLRAYVVIDNGLTNLLKKKEVLEKKIDQELVSKILEEVSQSTTLKDNIISQAQKLKEELAEKNDKESPELETIFLEDYLDFLEKHWRVKIWTGTEALHKLLTDINIEEELQEIKDSEGDKGLKKTKNEKLKFLKSLQKTKINLEWMIMNNLPVIPCGLRPITKLEDDDTIATTQINNLYRKVILINERLNYYLDLNKKFKIFFNEIIYNEKRRLQKAVDQLIYGSTNKRNDSKSLAQSLSGKEGILRRYSLGKRVDYSARSVIVPNPDLLLNQIGLPVIMALKLFKPFVIRKLLKEKIVFTVQEAEQLVKNEDPIIFFLLKQITQNHPVLANRAPSLHRLSIQGFYVVLTLGKSIELHPLITTALNADFDGDNLTIHLPLTEKACTEVRDYVLSTHHIIDPKNGYLIAIPTQDMILGIYYLTCEKKGKAIKFYDEIGNIQKSCDQGTLNLHDLIVIPASLVGRNFANQSNQFLFTTPGKLLFHQILPASFPFYLNSLKDYNEKDHGEILGLAMSEIEKKWQELQPKTGWKKKDIISFLNKLVKIKTISREEVIEFLDKLKQIGFDQAARSGISISPFELEGVVNKEKELKQAEKEIKKVDDYSSQGFYNEEESKQKKITIWENCKDNLQQQLVNNLEKKNTASLYHIWDSGARASSENLTQIFAMRGLTTNYLGEVLETPIISSLWEGLSPFEFFISVYGAMKGMIDIALKTAEAGYLTRRLVEASQSIIISALDCQTKARILLEEDDPLNLAKRIYGRFLAQDIFGRKKEIILSRDTLLLEEEIKIIQKNKISSVWIRSPLTCELVNGLCQKCYGTDLSRPGEIVALGTAAGIIAAQSLGEPGTQLTMRTFHGGGIAGDEDITQGLPKVKQILDNIEPSKEEKATLAKVTGEITMAEEKIIKQKGESGAEITYSLGKGKSIRFRPGEVVEKGTRITSGKVNLEEYLKIMGRDECQKYIKEEIKEVYHNQGIDIDERHIEIIARQMLSRVEIENGGDSNYLVGEIISYQVVQKKNQELISNQKKPISFQNIISSLKDLASDPDSFLAGISFQNTLKNLVSYSLYKPVDYLQGIKENLIAGQLIPVGKGFEERKKFLK